MKLPGRLRLTTLGDVLGALHRGSCSGILELTEDRGMTHRLFFEAGMICDIESDLSRLRLGELLAAQGLLGGRVLSWLARRLIEVPQKRVGEILVEEGLATADLVRAGLRRQLRLKLDALFKLTDAQMTFRVPRPRAARSSPLSPGEFLHGRPRSRPRMRSDAREAPRSAGGPAFSSGGARTRAYATLGLLPGADRATVQQAFRRLARTMHPDRYPSASPPERARLLSRFAELSAAYHAIAS